MLQNNTDMQRANFKLWEILQTTDSVSSTNKSQGKKGNGWETSGSKENYKHDNQLKWGVLIQTIKHVIQDKRTLEHYIFDDIKDIYQNIYGGSATISEISSK